MNKWIPKDRNTPTARWHNAGYTLVEVMISTFIVTLVAGSVIKSVSVARNLSYASNQRLAAFSLAKARFEEIKTLKYAEIYAANFPFESDIEFAHLAGTSQQPVHAWRQTEISDESNPNRKTIRINIYWRSGGGWLTETVTGCVYPG